MHVGQLLRVGLLGAVVVRTGAPYRQHTGATPLAAPLFTRTVRGPTPTPMRIPAVMAKQTRLFFTGITPKHPLKPNRVLVYSGPLPEARVVRTPAKHTGQTPFHPLKSGRVQVYTGPLPEARLTDIAAKHTGLTPFHPVQPNRMVLAVGPLPDARLVRSGVRHPGAPAAPSPRIDVTQLVQGQGPPVPAAVVVRSPLQKTGATPYAGPLFSRTVRGATPISLRAIPAVVVRSRVAHVATAAPTPGPAPKHRVVVGQGPPLPIAVIVQKNPLHTGLVPSVVFGRVLTGEMPLPGARVLRAWQLHTGATPPVSTPRRQLHQVVVVAGPLPHAIVKKTQPFHTGLSATPQLVERNRSLVATGPLPTALIVRSPLRHTGATPASPSVHLVRARLVLVARGELPDARVLRRQPMHTGLVPSVVYGRLVVGEAPLPGARVLRRDPMHTGQVAGPPPQRLHRLVIGSAPLPGSVLVRIGPDHTGVRPRKPLRPGRLVIGVGPLPTLVLHRDVGQRHSSPFAAAIHAMAINELDTPIRYEHALVTPIRWADERTTPIEEG